MESVIYTFLDSLMDYGIQGWLDAHLRGSKSSFSSYINGSTANFQEGFSMSVDKRDFTFTKELHEKLALYKEKKSRTTRFPVKNKFEASNPDKGKVLPSVRVSDPGLLLKPDEPNLIIMAKPACGPSKRDKPVGMDED
ncbi:TCP-1/cpn60 chaperonin family protein [Prunus dulcis]|uniref:TCP-1/cpn60 chaperonin family protein n=1 Tax=Prunus dulcis TaxID=3755 RepID=A0A4Y1R4V9_PRUDU|nr:TCP-1/cpn60 chaperonin family protein [Prunus dulcis]